jgi:hypothetical protein
MDTYGQRTASTESVEYDTFRLDAEACIEVVERCDGLADKVITSFIDRVRRAPGLDSERSLPGCGTNLIGRKALVRPLGAAKTIKSGGGKHKSIARSCRKLLQACVDVATNIDEFDIRP